MNGPAGRPWGATAPSRSPPEHGLLLSSPAPLALILRNGSVLALLMAAAAFLRLPEGLFLALGALTVLESDLGQGVLAGRERLLGTLCGLVAVVIAAGALGGAPLPLAIFGGLTLVRLFSFAAGLRSGYIVGGQVVAGACSTTASSGGPMPCSERSPPCWGWGSAFSCRGTSTASAACCSGSPTAASGCSTWPMPSRARP